MPSCHCDVAEHERRPLEPRDPPQRREIGAHVEVPVALLPARDRITRDRVHLHLEREQVVAPLDPVPRVHLLEEELRVQPLAHQAALHVREGDDDGVDGAAPDVRPQLLDAQHARILFRPGAADTPASRSLDRPACLTVPCYMGEYATGSALGGDVRTCHR